MRAFLQAIYDGKLNMPDLHLQQIARESKFDLYSREYRVMIVSSMSEIENSEQYHRYCVELPERCRKFFAKIDLRAKVTSDAPGKCIVLLMQSTEKSSAERMMHALISYLDAHSFSDTVIAAGECVPSLAEVAYSYRTSVNALNYASLYSGERCLFCEDMQTMLNLSSLRSVIDPNRMLEAFQADDIEGLRALVTAYAENVRALSGDSIEGKHPTSIRRMFVELTVYVLHIASDIGVDVDGILNGLDPYNFLLANDKSTPIIIDWFIDMCSDLRRAINEKTKIKEENIIHQACDYISRHITQYDLSLDSVAAAVNMTPSYLSRLFHKEMGIGFSKFIVQSRLKIACGMLTEENLSVKEISDRSGFASANYFGTVFKKEFGVSPATYRKQNAHLKSDHSEP